MLSLKQEDKKKLEFTRMLAVDDTNSLVFYFIFMKQKIKLLETGKKK